MAVCRYFLSKPSNSKNRGNNQNIEKNKNGKLGIHWDLGKFTVHFNAGWACVEIITDFTICMIF